MPLLSIEADLARQQCLHLDERVLVVDARQLVSLAALVQKRADALQQVELFLQLALDPRLQQLEHAIRDLARRRGAT